MLVRTLQVVVHCEHQTLWNMLMDRLQHPERYLVGITEARVTEESEDVFISEMLLHGEPVKERVLVRPYDGELRHELLEHPQFTGFIVKKILKTAIQSPVAPLYLEYELDLLRKSLKVQGVVRGEEEILTDLGAEMQKMRTRAEETDSRR
ncbi:hypothetical protein GEOBRER4_n3451 [Citrifermentans bremense]|uniref:Uncharacterized protein n=1 Tax=Citrifermentans bremense TaxID=60035 RepID=A0A6S6MAR2_9BACT|nr:DUF1857 family protein [Citrifermentans bremense]BCG48555.1 hypothetical protein GEOBRER4_n3451 [Citrifermentans bremense]